jgi:hypothetical protein
VLVETADERVVVGAVMSKMNTMEFDAVLSFSALSCAHSVYVQCTFGLS